MNLLRSISAVLLLTSGLLAQPRVLLYYDMEGLSGIKDWRLTSFSQPEYAKGREFLTSDVNAAIRGLKAGGAGSIVVTDAHGSGNPEPDIILDRLDPRATFEFRDTSFAPYTDMPSDRFDAIVCIGMHARAFTPGFLAHTYTLEPAFTVNGTHFTETTIIGVSAARFGIPVIMVSGDDVLEKQFKEQFPNGEFAVVKIAKGRGDADTLDQTVVQERIAGAAERAIKKLTTFSPFVFKGPYEFAMSFQNRTQTDIAALYPGLERRGDTTLVFRATDFFEGYRKSLVLVSLSTLTRTSLIWQAIREQENAAEIIQRYRELLHERWFEPGDFWSPASQPSDRYHGAR